MATGTTAYGHFSFMHRNERQFLAASLPEYPRCVGHQLMAEVGDVRRSISKRAGDKPYRIYMMISANKFLHIYYATVKRYLDSIEA